MKSFTFNHKLETAEDSARSLMKCQFQWIENSLIVSFYRHDNKHEQDTQRERDRDRARGGGRSITTIYSIFYSDPLYIEHTGRNWTRPTYFVNS